MSAIDVPKAFHVMAKPAGSACNLSCEYCFFRKKGRLYPGSNFRMSDEVHETYIRQLFETHQAAQVTVAWQGGEPSLMGLHFFRRSIKLQKEYAKPGTLIENTFQTNGILLNDEWSQFFHENNFLVGLSLDGPKELHDIYRKDREGNGTFYRTVQAIDLLERHKVDFNILCTVNAKNAERPLDIYRFFRDYLGVQYIQFIPIVERDSDSGFQEGEKVTDRSVRPDQWGRFLIAIFDEWVKSDVGRTFVFNFNGALAGWLGLASTVCVFGPTCGEYLALEHNGDLYSCDHFVEPNYYLGNIMKTPLIDLISSDTQRRFGRNKKDMLPLYCRECEVVHICNGECPKNRFIEGPDGEPGLNYLCNGYKTFFKHADKSMRIIADFIRTGRRLAEEVMQNVRMTENEGNKIRMNQGRSHPCFFGSGAKFKKCHGTVSGN
jgi:uncharacterized protein